MGKKNYESLICLMFSVLLFSGNVFSQTALIGTVHLVPAFLKLIMFRTHGSCEKL